MRAAKLGGILGLCVFVVGLVLVCTGVFAVFGVWAMVAGVMAPFIFWLIDANASAGPMPGWTGKLLLAVVAAGIAWLAWAMHAMGR